MKFLGAQYWFRLACLFELAILGLAVLAGWLWHRPLRASFHWNIRDAGIGFLAALPLFALFRASLRSRWKPLADIRGFLETDLRPIFTPWSLWQLAVVSLLAGWGEESLFRAVLQGGLTDAVGFPVALVLTSVIFGVGHCVNRAYAVTAAGTGIYLGLLWWWTGNLLAPAVTHALYDFAALVYFLRIARPPPATSAIV